MQIRMYVNFLPTWQRSIYVYSLYEVVVRKGLVVDGNHFYGHLKKWYNKEEIYWIIY